METSPPNLTTTKASPPPPPPPPSLSPAVVAGGEEEEERRDGRDVAGDQCAGGGGARGRVGLQGAAGGEVPDGEVGRGGDDPGGGAERAADDAGDRREPGHLPDGDDARRQRRGGQRGDQLHGHLLHALPPRRLRRRLLPRPLPHHRHLHSRPGLGRDDPDDLDGGAGAEAGGVRGGVAGVRARDGGADGGALPSPVPDGAGHWRPQVERLRLRLRPVRRVQRRREVSDDAILQLVLLLHQPRLAARRHGARLRPGQPRPAMGLRRVRRRHRRRARRLPRRDAQVPVQEAGGEPADADRRRRRRRVAQAPPRAPLRPRHALRHRRRQARRRRGGLLQEEQAQAATPPHQAVQVLGPRGDQRRAGRRAEQVVAGDADGRGGGEDGGADAPHLGDDDHVLDGVRPDDHLLRLPGHHHGPPHRRLLPDSGGLPHRLLRRLHPPHRPNLRPPRRPRRAPPLRQPARPHSTPAHRRRPRALHRRHGLRRAHRGKAAARGEGRAGRRRRDGPHDGVLAHPAVLVRRLRRGVHLHRPARLLPPRVPQGYEDDEHGAVPQHALAGLLRQLGARRRRPQAHRRPPSMARRRPQQGPARQVLLAPRRHLPRQPPRLPRRRQVVQVQGRPPRRRRHRQRRRDGRRRAMPPLIQTVHLSIDRTATISSSHLVLYIYICSTYVRACVPARHVCVYVYV